MRNTAISLSQVSPLAGAADEALAVSSTAVVLTSTLAGNCTHVLLTVGVNAIRVRFDGQAPTASAGHYLPAGALLLVTKASAIAARFIRVASDSDIHATQMAP